MPIDGILTTAAIRALFAKEITAAGGSVAETFDDGTRLFTRSVLPRMCEVQASDRLQSGVALRATADEVWVHPYVFRLVCRNGAIMAQALETCHIETPEFTTVEAAADAVRDAVQACCAEEAFTRAVDGMRAARHTQVDLALNMLPLLSRLPRESAAQLLGEIMRRFSQEADQSQFGLMNAVTALARDTRDPGTRWRLEELGGAIPALRPLRPQPHDAVAEMALVG
jgi:hypothetical protein